MSRYYPGAVDEQVLPGGLWMSKYFAVDVDAEVPSDEHSPVDIHVAADYMLAALFVHQARF